MDKLVWPCQIGLKRINFFSTLNKLKLSRPGEDLLKICWHSPGMPIILMYHILTRPQTSLGWNITAGSEASWPDSGEPSQFSRKMQEKESPKFKKKKVVNLWGSLPLTSPGVSFPFFTHHFTDLWLLMSVGSPKFLLILPNKENTWFLASHLKTELPCLGPPCWTTQLSGGSF